MTPEHPLWARFVKELTGPRGIDLHVVDGRRAWVCDGSVARPFARRILASMGMDAEASLAAFAKARACCDCEIVFGLGDYVGNDITLRKR